MEVTDNNQANLVASDMTASLPPLAGEVALPGGKRDDEDANDTATALREAQEELGVDPQSVTILGQLPPFLSKHLLSVTPVIAQVSNYCHAVIVRSVAMGHGALTYCH